jgi:hypothetical protein
LSEIQLMTYWLTYMYVRCNRSVSYPAPAYYSHWASRRARVLGNDLISQDPDGVQTNDMLIEFSIDWLRGDRTQCMNFV